MSGRERFCPGFFRGRRFRGWRSAWGLRHRAIRPDWRRGLCPTVVMVAGKACVVVAVAVLPPQCADAGVDFGIGTQSVLEVEVGIEDIAVFAPVAQASGDFDGGVLRGEKVSGSALAVNVRAAVVVSQGCADFEAVLGGGDAFQAERQVGVSVCGEKK